MRFDGFVLRFDKFVASTTCSTAGFSPVIPTSRDFLLDLRKLFLFRRLVRLFYLTASGSIFLMSTGFSAIFPISTGSFFISPLNFISISGMLMPTFLTPISIMASCPSFDSFLSRLRPFSFSTGY